jgi:RNA polymerase sigma-70 factor (ECF subfamily)
VLKQARAGVTSAQNRLLDENRSWLKRIARRLVPSALARKEDASDLVQKTMHEAHRRLDQFRGSKVREYRNWLQGILRKMVWTLIRKHAKDMQVKPLPISSGGEILVPQEQTPVAERFDKNLDMQRLNQALEELEEPERRLLQLKYFDQLSYEAIAQTLGEDAGREELAKLRQRIHRLLQKLQLGIMLLGALESLPPHYHKVVCRRHFRGASLDNIAEEMGCSAAAVSKWLTEAKKRLPADLREYL